MSKESSIALGKLRTGFVRCPFPPMFSRIVSVLLTYVDRDTMCAWPSQQRLGDQVGCNEKTVKRNLAAARNLGLLTIESVDAKELRQRVGGTRRLGSHHRFTIYTISPDHPLWKGSPEEVAAARTIIKESTHLGVEQRCAAK